MAVLDRTVKIEAMDTCFNDVINCNKRPRLLYKVWDYDSGWIPGDQSNEGIYCDMIKKNGHNRHLYIEVDSYDMKSNHHY